MRTPSAASRSRFSDIEEGRLAAARRPDDDGSCCRDVQVDVLEDMEIAVEDVEVRMLMGTCPFMIGARPLLDDMPGCLPAHGPAAG